MGVVIPGMAIADQIYGAFTAISDMEILGLQASVNGNLVEGGDTEFVVRIAGIDYSAAPLVIEPGQRRAVVTFDTPQAIVEGQYIQFHCLSVGATYPGSWIELRVNVDTEISE